MAKNEENTICCPLKAVNEGHSLKTNCDRYICSGPRIKYEFSKQVVTTKADQVQ